MGAKRPVALTVAGSDSGGGAGVQADLKTFAALGVHGTCAITALTAQNTRGVTLVEPTRPEALKAQLEAVFADFDVAAIKIGMLATPANVRALAQALIAEALRMSHDGRGRRAPFVVFDPVLKASSGDALSEGGFIAALKDRLLARVDLLTPNLAEAGALLGSDEARDESAMAEQGRALLDLGPRAVLMKGGHLAGADAVDVLVTREGLRRFAAPRLDAVNTHGTGCTLSSAIAAEIALGAPLEDAVGAAKAFVTAAIERARSVRLGDGPGPVLPLPLAPVARAAPGG